MRGKRIGGDPPAPATLALFLILSLILTLALALALILTLPHPCARSSGGPPGLEARGKRGRVSKPAPRGGLLLGTACGALPDQRHEHRLHLTELPSQFAIDQLDVPERPGHGEREAVEQRLVAPPREVPSVPSCQ